MVTAAKPFTTRSMPYALSELSSQAANEDRAAGLAFFLLDNVGSPAGYWAGHMKAADQRALLGRFVGKGRIHIDGSHETVRMTVAMAFGTMRDTVWDATWNELRH